MSSDWVPAVFALAGTLAGAAVSGGSALAGQRSQRQVAKQQAATADTLRREEIRQNTYVDFLATASAYRAALWNLLELQNDGRALKDLTAERDKISRCLAEYRRASETVRLMGPDSLLPSLEEVLDAFSDLDTLSENQYQAVRAGDTTRVMAAWDPIKTQIELLATKRRAFAQDAGKVIGFR